jgi:hypothetical protein
MVCYGDSFTVYVDVLPHRKHVWGSTACYGVSCTFLYVDDIRTSQNAHLWVFTACYEDSFTLLYVDAVRTSEETHLWAVMGIVLPFTTLHQATLLRSEVTLFKFRHCSTYFILPGRHHLP